MCYLFLTLPELTIFLHTEVNCGEPRNAPANGIKNGEIHTLGSVISYTCKKGYHIAGQQYHVRKAGMKCLVTGRWNASAPQCESKSAVSEGYFWHFSNIISLGQISAEVILQENPAQLFMSTFC